MLIAITGGIATGKSTVTQTLVELGDSVIDADIVARDVVKPSGRAYARLVGFLEPGYFTFKGTLDREKVAKKFFSDASFRSDFESIVHPYIWEEITYRIEEEQVSKTHVFCDIPLLFEHHKSNLFDQVWVVYCTPEQQLERLVKRNKLSHSEALKRIRSQLPLEHKLEKADRIIDNRGSLEDTKALVQTYRSELDE